MIAFFSVSLSLDLISNCVSPLLLSNHGDMQLRPTCVHLISEWAELLHSISLLVLVRMRLCQKVCSQLCGLGCLLDFWN